MSNINLSEISSNMVEMADMFEMADIVEEVVIETEVVEGINFYL
jgi:hypothetical protein